MELRQRHRDAQESVTVNTHPIRRLAAVDMFTKPVEEYQRSQTPLGGIISACTLGLILLLLAWETVSYAIGHNAYRTELSVHKSVSGELLINIDITFPRVQCHLLSVGFTDATGAKSFDVTKNLNKLPVTFAGTIAYKGSRILLNAYNARNTNNSTESSLEYCGPCSVAVENDAFAERDAVDVPEHAAQATDCCNSCEAVLQFYEKRGLGRPAISLIPQCLSHLSVVHPGCNVRGALYLNKVSGTIIFAPRRVRGFFAMSDIVVFNSSHQIRHFSIGSRSVPRFSPRGISEPLIGHTFTSKFYAEVKYFLNIVPTTYITKRTRSLHPATFEYSVKLHNRSIHPGYMGAVPSVIMGYDISPLEVNNYFERTSFAHFIVQLCGIVGGLFVLLGVIDRCASHCLRSSSSS